MCVAHVWLRRSDEDDADSRPSSILGAGYCADEMRRLLSGLVLRCSGSSCFLQPRLVPYCAAKQEPNVLLPLYTLACGPITHNDAPAALLPLPLFSPRDRASFHRLSSPPVALLQLLDDATKAGTFLSGDGSDGKLSDKEQVVF